MLSNSERKFTNSYLIIKFKYQNEISGICYDKEDDFNLYRRETVSDAFNRFTTRSGITFYKNKELYFYLSSGDNYILIDKEQKIQDLGINDGDTIEKSTKIKNTDVIYKIKTNSKRMKKILIFLIIFAILLVVTAVALLLYYFVFRDKKEIIVKKEEYKREELVTKISYIPDVLYRYQSNKRTNLIVEGGNITDEDSLRGMEQYIDFIFILRNKYYEIENNETQKFWYKGYIGILNITINNGTDDIEVFHDTNLSRYINQLDKSKIISKNNLRNLNINSDSIKEENEEKNNDTDTETNTNAISSFIKIEFYENGQIKNIYLPKYLIKSNMVFIDNIIKLLIPKLSPSLYIKNIAEKLKELNYHISANVSNSEYEEDNNDEIYDTFNEIYDTDIEITDSNNENEDSDILENELNSEKETNINRRLEDKSYVNNIETTNLYENDNAEKENDDDVEDSVEPKNVTESTYIDLREVNIFNEIFSLDNNSFNISENITIKNYTNLTEFFSQPLENDEMSLKDSEVNTIIYSSIDDKGILFAIKEIQTAAMNQPDNNEDEEQKKEEKLRNDIYNSNNQISYDEANFEEKINNDFSFNLTKISMESENNIYLKSTLDNDELRHNLYKYFDEFEYVLYNETNDTQNKLRVLSSYDVDNENITEQKEYEKLIKEYQKERKRKLKRKISYSDDYYGMKTFTYEKEFFNYNLLGLSLKGNAVCEIEPSTGIVHNYFNLGLSRFNKKFNLATQQTNLHIVIERLNKMTFDFISLLYQSNKNLNNNNKKYGDIIIEIEKNVSNLFDKYFDYSGIFTDSLDNLYFQVSNFTGQFLTDLITLIDEVHSNYTIIFLKGMNDSYEFINEIREITKDAYIEYIHRMVNNLNLFNNQTLSFLDNIKEETEKIEIFQIDLLYDIIDLIYDAKIIFRDFNKNLFKAIEKGILTFKYDIKDQIEMIIGELLYITDFLAINLNKNEILRNAIEESQRNITVSKLKDFRDIIFVIMDLLINKIYNDYDEEMSSNNNNSIKYYSEEALKIFINDIELNTDKTSDLIKTKIKYINLYENYSENINNINNIFKKAGEDFNNEIYNKIIKNISFIAPEFLNKENSILIKDKQILYNITKKLTFSINNEIKQIDEEAKDISDKYIQDQLYFLHYNLYNFKNIFLNDKLNKLMNDFISIVENNMKINYIQLIDENYNLITQYLNEENDFISRIGGNVYLGQGFVDRYYKFVKESKEFMSLSYSDEFISDLENFFYKIKNDILNHINNQLKSINKYKLNSEIIKNNFYLIEKISNEIIAIIDNINNFFNEENFMMQIKLRAINIGTDIIMPYEENKEKELSNLYDKITKRIGNKIYPTSADYFKMTKKRKKIRFWKTYFVYDYYYCKSRNNINIINTDLSKINNNISNQLNSLISNYINTYNPYLSEYVSISQNLYTNIHQFYQNKINEHQNIKNIMNEYEVYFNEMISKINIDIIKVDNFNLDNAFKACLNTLDNNLNNIKEKYYKNIYLNSYEDFLEYPNEIIFKINQYKNELESDIENVKNKINIIYKKRIINLLEETKTFIQDIHDFNFNFVLINLDKFNPNVDYYDIKNNVIKEYFSSYSNKLNERLNEIIIGDDNEQILFKESDLNIDIKNLEDKYSNFVTAFEEIILQNFTVEKCKEIYMINTDSNLISGLFSDINLENSDMTDLKECWTEIKKSELNYSIYNFNTVKIRSEIYFAKTLIEKIDDCFDDINYNDIINKDKINEFDSILNNKNILEIYNETQIKLKEIQDDNEYMLDEPFELFMNSLKDNYKIENEITPFFKLFEEIILNKNLNYSNYMKANNEEVLKEINDILDEFQKVLNDQISLKNNYERFNIDKNDFNSIYLTYYSELENIFTTYKNKTNNLKEDGLFYNSLQLLIRKFKNDKAKYFGDLFNDYIKSLGYDFEFFNYTYDLGQNIIIFLKDEYLEYEYDFKYKYFLLFENNSETYIKKIIPDIIKIESEVKNKFQKIYDEFIQNFEKGADSNLKYEYYTEYKNNYSNCLAYKGKNLIDNIKQDLLDNNYTEEEINIILDQCNFEMEELKLKDIDKQLYSDSDIISDKVMETDIGETDTTLEDNRYKCSYINQKVMDFLHVKNYLFCEENNYFNSNIFYFNNFSEKNKNELDKVINNIKIKIENNYIDGKFLYDYLKNITYYEKEEITLENFDVYLENIYEITSFINDLNDNDYKQFLNKSLISSFALSYGGLVNNYIINEMIDNSTILIDNKIELYLDNIQEKINNEYLYYIFLINGTEELGNSTQLSLLNYFTNLFEKIKNSIEYSVEYEVNFYIDIFYRENKNLFTNNFINYYIQENNEYNISIYKLDNYIGELIYDNFFNKTLNNYSYSFIQSITNQIKMNIKQYTEDKIQSLYNSINTIYINLENIISTKEIIDINEEMFTIYNLIQNFSLVVKNQDNRFIFKVGEDPFELINVFVDEELRPPLILIKEKYNFIEEKILELIVTIADNFPDCYALVRDNFINNRVEDVYYYIIDINNTIMEYKDILNEDIESYINKLSYYTFIDGLNAYENPCNESSCMINNTRKNIIRKLETSTNEKNKDINYNYSYTYNNRNKNFSKNLKSKNWKKNKNIFLKRFLKRELNVYESSDPGLSKDDVIPYIEDIVNKILDFDKMYIGQEYKKINTTVNKYLIKINGTCLNNLKRSFSIKLQKFSTLITEEKMEFLKNKIMAQYYQIEPFIHEMSDYIQDLISNFTDMINSTKRINKLMSEHINEKINSYYDLLTDNIQSKYKLIERKSLTINIVEIGKEENNGLTVGASFDFFKKSKDEINRQLNELDEYLFNIEDKVVSCAKDVTNKVISYAKDITNKAVNYIKDIFGTKDKEDKNKEGGGKNEGEEGEESLLSKFKKAYDFMKDILNFFDRDFINQEYVTSIPLPVFPNLFLVITNYVQLGSRLEIKPITDETIGLSIDLSVKGEIGTSLDVGIYVPDPKSPVVISVNAGMKGILASGRVGIKLSLYLVKERYETDLYFIFNAFAFEFYVKFEIKIRVWRLNFSFVFYLIKYKFVLLTIEKHKIKLHDMKFLNLRTKMLLENKIKNVLK